MKFNKFTLGLAAVLSLAFAGLNLQAGLQTQLSTNALAVLSTNTFALNGDQTGIYTNGETTAVPLIAAAQTTQLPMLVGGYFTNSTANSSNVTFAVYAAVDNNLWFNATNIIVSIPANTTNWVSQSVWLSSSGSGVFPVYALRTIANTNTANVTARAGTLFLKAFVKTGI